MTEDPTTKTVKGISEARWARGMLCARQARQSMGDWLGDAIEEKASRQQNAELLPPGPSTADPPPAKPAEDLARADTVARMLAAVAAFAANSAALPTRLRQQGNAAANQELRALRGLPALPYRPRTAPDAEPGRQTAGKKSARSGQTEPD